MKRQAMAGLRVFRDSHDFLAGTQVPGALGPVTKTVEALGQIADRLAAHAVDQDEHDRAFRGGAKEAQERARLLRVNFMLPVAGMAKSLFPDDPAIRQALALPKGRGYERSIAAALAMAGRAEEHKERFVAVGFGEDFIERLRNGANDLRAALNKKGTHYGKRSAATAGIRDELGRGKSLVRLLDKLVSPGLHGTQDRLAEWRTVSRFARPAKVVEEVTTLPSVGAPNVAAAGPPAAPAVVIPAGATAAQESPVIGRAA